MLDILDTMLLYYAGMAAGIAYLIGDIVGGTITPSYSYKANAVSELVQSGAKNRAFLSSFLFFHAVMIILFSIGIIMDHPYQESPMIFLAGIGMLVVGISHGLSSSLFPQDPVGDEATFPGRMHLVLVGVSVVLLFIVLPLMAQGMFVDRDWTAFRIFSFVCLPVMVIGGVLTPVVIAKGIGAMGVTERVVGYTFYIWLFVLAFLLVF